MSKQYFTDSQKDFFKNLLGITHDNKRKDIIIKILVEFTKFYRITILTELYLSEKFLIKNHELSSNYITSWTDWIFRKKRDYVKDYFISNNIFITDNCNFLNFEILCFIENKPVILLRNIENFIYYTEDILNNNDPIILSKMCIDNFEIMSNINSIIYGIEIGKINRFIVTTKLSSKISYCFNNIKGWNIRSFYNSDLKWFNEIQ